MGEIQHQKLYKILFNNSKKKKELIKKNNANTQAFLKNKTVENQITFIISKFLKVHKEKEKLSLFFRILLVLKRD